ncbi:hypothetical protein AW736_20570 [Termitidicoccus mucosus]|uniref:Uncharacterized protein n=1 Tax=Termitidicoccus mucosus TaxID=1184151 RepID=A0A178IDS1_9BACT|nr:hypothetical protein AW736_20570 [Opitutaceae bacterium TSB47]
MPRLARTVSLCILAASLFPTARAARSFEWRPIGPADLESIAPPLAPEIGAEILYRYEEIDDSDRHSGARCRDYFRIKIYNQKGLSHIDKIDIPCPDGMSIRNLAARVIKPDGRVINVEKSAFHSREIVKQRRKRHQMTSFSFPGAEVGDIVEYKWESRAKDHFYWYTLSPMHDMPARHVEFQVSPFLAPGVDCSTYTHRCPPLEDMNGKDGFIPVHIFDTPAFKEEPYMPPKNDVRPWILFYPRVYLGGVLNFWARLGREKVEEVDACVGNPSKLIKETAAAIIGDVTGIEERARLINDYCRKNVINTDRHVPESGVIVKAKKRPSPDYTLQKKQGGTLDMIILYHALARASGLDTHIALCSNRDNGAFNRDIHLASALPDPLIALRDGMRWLFLDPATDVVPSGMLRWQNEGAQVLVSTPGRPMMWQTTLTMPAAKNLARRSAALRLDAEGTLAGSVRIDYSGHAEMSIRDDYMNETPAMRDEMLRARIQERLPSAEVTKIEMPGIDDVTSSFFITYDIRVPRYAEQLGKRLFFQPGYFEKGISPLFAAQERAHDVWFPFAWSEHDDIKIELPSGYTLEAASAPGSLLNANWGEYDVEILVHRKINTLEYKRRFKFAGTRVIQSGYPHIKALFEAIHRRDSHTLSLKADDAEP